MKALGAVIVAVARRAAHEVLTTVGSTGWIVTAFGIAAVIAGAVLGWAELLFVGITLLGAMLVAVPFALGRSTYQVEMYPEPRRMQADAPGLPRDGNPPAIVVSVTNASGREAPSVRMEVPMTRFRPDPAFSVPRLRSEETTSTRLLLDTSRRGVIAVGPASSVRGDPLGLLRRRVSWTGKEEVFVRPRTVHTPSSASGLVRDLEGRTSTVITNSDLSFHALRSYEPGDDPRMIHWRATARASSADPSALMVRQFEEARRSQLTVIHSTDMAFYASEDEFELAVSLTASVVSQAVREGTTVSMFTDAGPFPVHSRESFLDELCRVEPAREPYINFRAFGTFVIKSAPISSVVLVVGGSGHAENDFRMVENQFPFETTILGLRARMAGSRSIARPGRTLVMTARELTDLPKLLGHAL